MSDDFGRIILEGLLNAQASSGKSKKEDSAPPELSQAKALQETYDLFVKKESSFKEGDLITIKNESLCMWKTSKVGRVLVVTDVIEKPFFGYERQNDADEVRSIGSPYSALRYDIIAAYIDKDGGLTQHCYDSRRFKKYDGPVGKNILTLGRK